MTTQAVLSTILLISIPLLLPTSTNATTEGPEPAKLGMYRVRSSTICAAVVNTDQNSSLDEPNKTPDPRSMFGNAEKLPLSECRHPHDFVIVQQGRYALLSDTDVVASLLGRNYSFTFCVNTEHRTNFFCYKNGETYFVAPTDYEKVLIRGPVGFYTCPQTFEALYGGHLSLIQDEHQCATFLTVSSYAVRTDSGDCIHLFRYALFKEYPEVWNGCQRYAKAGNGKAFYDCQFNAAPEPWNYPTREEVSRCSDYAPRVACSSVQFYSQAYARYFYAGRGVGEMTQNKMDSESCQPFSARDLINYYDRKPIGTGSTGSHYKRAAAIGGGGFIAAFLALVARFVCRMYMFGNLCRRREPELPETVGRSSVHLPAEPTTSLPAPPTSGIGNSGTAFSTPAQPSNAASGALVGQMRGVFSVPPSDVPYERLQTV